MMRLLVLLAAATLVSGCISFNSSESPAGPDYATFCQDKEAQCRDICGDAGVAAFSCKAAPREGLDYSCQCKKPGTKL
ncbi:hypothetical protein F8A86_07545 [Betaproteobacteria bacterium SCN1]|nr:hypothetical protein F8A86_07545 [Betaproteobacteria bacterium SCN1]